MERWNEEESLTCLLCSRRGVEGHVRARANAPLKPTTNTTPHKPTPKTPGKHVADALPALGTAILNEDGHNRPPRLRGIAVSTLTALLANERVRCVCLALHAHPAEPPSSRAHL